jgi:probable rRNA maturation factor
LIIYLDSDFDGTFRGETFDESFFYAVASAAACDVNLAENAELSVVLADDDFIRGLNSGFRGIDKATDVLSFPQDDELILGDIVISLETAARRAEEEDMSLREETAFLFIHGLLHLKGFDHTSEDEEKEMFALQERCFERWKAYVGKGKP